MRKKSGIVLMTAGALLIAAALALLVYNSIEADGAAKAAESVMPEIIEAIEESEDNEPGAQPLPSESTEMAVVTVNGNDYIGYVKIPALGLELPVMSDWSYTKLKTAPCRHFGSVAGKDLVIAAHNYARHFGKLSALRQGDTVLFTDVNGRTTVYTVVSNEIFKPTDVSAVKDSPWDLVLYSCTKGGRTRIVVGCMIADT